MEVQLILISTMEEELSWLGVSLRTLIEI